MQLKRKLGSLGKVSAPPYLRHLVQIRLDNAQQENWRAWLRDALEYRWSKIRTTEGIWYLTRLMGMAATFILFLGITSSISPLYLEIGDNRGFPQNARLQLGQNVLKNLGLTPVEAQRRPISPSEPRINDLYLLNFGQNVSRSGQDDSLTVLTAVDRSGAAKIQNVIEYPVDSTLLSDFNSMIASARCRPASQNGRAIDSHLVLTFSRISVYD
jgi:hypothetical protein